VPEVALSFEGVSPAGAVYAEVPAKPTSRRTCAFSRPSAKRVIGPGPLRRCAEDIQEARVGTLDQAASKRADAALAHRKRSASGIQYDRSLPTTRSRRS